MGEFIELGKYNGKSQIKADLALFRPIESWLIRNAIQAKIAVRGFVYVKFSNAEDAMLCYLRFK